MRRALRRIAPAALLAGLIAPLTSEGIIDPLKAIQRQHEDTKRPLCPSGNEPLDRLLNGKAIQARVVNPNGRAALLTRQKLTDKEVVTEMYLWSVARHPNADSTTLAWLAKDRSQPLWYLVAFNPNTPAVLRRRLQDRLRKLGQSASSK